MAFRPSMILTGTGETSALADGNPVVWSFGEGFGLALMTSFCNASTLDVIRAKLPAAGILRLRTFRVIFAWYCGRFPARSTTCRPTIHPTAPRIVNATTTHNKHRWHSADPLLQPAYQSRQQKCDQRGERDRDKDGAAEIKRHDDESEDQNRPDTVQSHSRVGGKSACAHPDRLVGPVGL